VNIKKWREDKFVGVQKRSKSVLTFILLMVKDYQQAED
jgi:hypothetical protein